MDVNTEQLEGLSPEEKRKLLGEILRRKIAARKPDLEAEAEIDLEVDPVACAESLEHLSNPAAVFLTGGTGFVGAFLLRELTESTGSSIYCLVRAGDEASGLSRIRENLESYGIWDEGMSSRIIPVPGDLKQERLGLSAPRFTQLAKEVDGIFHLAASVNLALKYEHLRPTNVNGTRQVLRFAASGRPKPLHYLSSYALFDSVRNVNKTIWEKDGPQEADGLSNGYSESKWVAERMVRNARTAGLPVGIYRVGWVAGHSQSGVWNKSDFMYQMIQACIAAGKYCYLGTMTMTPVDYLTKSLIYLATKPESIGDVFHLSNGTQYSSDQLFEWVNAFGYDLEKVSYKDWENEMRKTDQGVLAPMMLFLESAPQDFSLADWYSQEPQFNVDATRAKLAPSSIDCPHLSPELVAVYVRRLIDNGQLSPPPAAGSSTADESRGSAG